MRISYPFTQAYLTCGLSILVLSSGTPLTAAPTIPGLHQQHSLTTAQEGKALISELRCAACHDGLDPEVPSAPLLDGVGSRLTPDFLKKFIESPSSHDPGTAMPNVLAAQPSKERDEVVDALSAYLLSLTHEAKEEANPKAANAARGKELYHEIGCIACHSPRDDGGKELSREGDIGLSHLKAKYQPNGLTAFLYEPLKFRPAGRMPDMNLTIDEASALTAYLLGDTTSGGQDVAAEPATALVNTGKKAFADMNCVACHQLEDLDSSTPRSGANAPSRDKLDPQRGCLSESPNKAPDYKLSDHQKTAIRAALSDTTTAPTTQVIKQRLTQLNCIACHQRDDYGGVLEDRDSYFHSTEEALGDEARLPPSLTLTGAKLRPEWMNKVLYDGAKVRPYMKTRMPQFGTEALKGLTEQFGETDKLPPLEYEPLDRESKPMMRNGAHMLLGNKGLNCIACHNYNGKESPGMKGLDLMTSYQRLEPAWFDQFMRNPAKMRPGIIMPSFWPDGKAIQTEILNGNTEDQLRALWYNFSLGRSARDPSGLRVEPSKLVVTDRAKTYRGRSKVAGYRGIAVGLPGGLNYAFNAQTGAFSAIWSGEFVSVGWQGQGSGNFNPIGRPIQLAQDVAFLSDLPDQWPLHPQRTKENPINPDPIYPRQHGYAFEGYSMDAEGVPTFHYRSGDVSIEDTTRLTTDGSSPVLRRTLIFQNEKPTKRHLRILTGPVERLSERSFKSANLTLLLDSSFDPQGAVLRKSSEDGIGNELLLNLQLPAGTSTKTLDYVIQQ